MSKKLAQGWIRKKIKELPILISDGNYSSKYPKAEELIAEGIPFIRVNNLQNNTIVSNDMKYISKDKHNILLKGHLKENDVLITVRGDLGKVAIVPKEYDDANINAQIALLRITDSSILNSKFLLYSIKNPLVQLEIDKCKTGSALKQLPIAKLKEIYLNIPSLEEQERIVSILETAEKAIQKREESNRLLDEYLKSVFIDMFGDPVTNTKGWKKIKLKDISNYLKRGKSPKYSDRSSINVINQKCIYWRDFKPENCKCYNEEFIDKIKGEFLDSGDIVINSTGTGTLGRALVLKNIKSNLYVADSHITVMKVNEFANPVYITTLLELKNIQSQVYAKCVNGSTNQIELSVSKLGSYKIMVPPIESQNKFADIVNQVDKLKVQMESSLKELENNFNSLMQKAFNGEL